MAVFKRKILAACESIEYKRFGSALLNVQAAKEAAESVRADHDATVLKTMLVNWLDAQSGYGGRPSIDGEVLDAERITEEAEFLKASYDN